MAKELAGRLESEGVSTAVINPRFIKPLDLELIEHFARTATAFVTFEDHVKSGGFGSAILEALSQLGLSTPVVRIGWPDQFIEHGKVDQLRLTHGLSAQAAYNQLQPYLAPIRHRTRVAI
jgi:1-deoxy-D-xylulose-5-phosphate synthase